MTPEEQGLELAKQIYAQRYEAIKELQDKMVLDGKYPDQYIIADNWPLVLDSIDKGDPIPYRCWEVPKLAANELI